MGGVISPGPVPVPVGTPPPGTLAVDTVGTTVGSTGGRPEPAGGGIGGCPGTGVAGTSGWPGIGVAGTSG